MIRGMTGFGAATISFGRFKAVVEIKSQNHRYLDIVYYLPVGFSSYEDGIRQTISKFMDRGRITVVFKVTEKPQQELNFNRDVVREYLKHAKELAKEFGLKDHLSLADLIRLPGVFEVKEARLETTDFWPTFEKGLRKAIDGLMRMRAREGVSLTRDFKGILNRMKLQLKKIESRTKDILREKKKELSTEEFLSLQKGNNVSEEITRLAHYIDEFKLHLQEEVGVAVLKVESKQAGHGIEAL